MADARQFGHSGAPAPHGGRPSVVYCAGCGRPILGDPGDRCDACRATHEQHGTPFSAAPPAADPSSLEQPRPAAQRSALDIEPGLAVPTHVDDAFRRDIPNNEFDAWAQRLAHYYFRTENRGTPVVMFVDDESLGEAAGMDPATAAASLGSAVRSRLALNAPDIFDHIHRDASLWRANGGTTSPPFLPVLAIAVLAAAHMARDGTFSARNYYRPFRRVVGLPLEGGMPRGYDQSLPDMWNYLNWWMDKRWGGVFGTCTAVPLSGFTNIGYALSQTVLRTSDRERLTDFFSAIDAEPGEDIEPHELLVYYRAWVGRAHISSAARVMAYRAESADQIASILAAELKRWDGTIRQDARRVARIVVALDEIGRPTLRLLPERLDGFPEDFTCRDAQGRAQRLHALDDRWYQPLAMPVDRALEDGVRLTADDFALRLEPAGVLPMKQDADLGMWIATNQVRPFVTHCVLVRALLADDVSAFLSSHADHGWNRTTANAALPPGWVFFRRVVLSEPVSGVVPPELSSLVPAAHGRISLWRGLPLPRLRGVYLAGGEPDVWIPPLDNSAGNMTVSLDGESIGTAAQGESVRLRDRHLPAGQHIVAVGSVTRAFSTVDTLGNVEGEAAGSIVRRLKHTDRGYAVVGPDTDNTNPVMGHEVWVSGVRIAAADSDRPPPAPEVVRLRRGGTRYLLLGSRPGELEAVTSGLPPKWTRPLLLPPTLFEVAAPSFPVVWALVEWSNRWTTYLLHAAPPGSTNDDRPPEASVAWASAVLTDVLVEPDSARVLWGSYREAAAALL